MEPRTLRKSTVAQADRLSQAPSTPGIETQDEQAATVGQDAVDLAQHRLRRAGKFKRMRQQHGVNAFVENRQVLGFGQGLRAKAAHSSQHSAVQGFAAGQQLAAVAPAADLEQMPAENIRQYPAHFLLLKLKQPATARGTEPELESLPAEGPAAAARAWFAAHGRLTFALLMSNIIMMLDVHAIPAFTDNYLWLLTRGGDAVIVDPGDAAPVLQVLEARGLRLTAILITHWHPDHTGGITKLLDKVGTVPVYGPRAEFSRIPQITHQLDDGDKVDVLGQTFDVLAVPGHTLGHIAYFSDGQLFCGDTLFSAGCGRLFEGTPEQMHASLDRLAALPPQTKIYCTHEYTMSNLAFAITVEPQNKALLGRLDEVRQLRAAKQPSLPSSLEIELATNPFLRTTVHGVIKAAQAHSNQLSSKPDQVFAALRRWKDEFKTPAGF